LSTPAHKLSFLGGLQSTVISAYHCESIMNEWMDRKGILHTWALNAWASYGLLFSFEIVVPNRLPQSSQTCAWLWPILYHHNHIAMPCSKRLQSMPFLPHDLDLFGLKDSSGMLVLPDLFGLKVSSGMLVLPHILCSFMCCSKVKSMPFLPQCTLVRVCWKRVDAILTLFIHVSAPRTSQCLVHSYSAPRA
jgi:hypothetical protein